MPTIASEKDLVTIDQFSNRKPANETKHFMEEINTTIQLMQRDIKEINKRLDKNDLDHDKIETAVNKGSIAIISKLDSFIDRSNDKFASSKEFAFWRNVLISGILVSIFIGVIALLLKGS